MIKKICDSDLFFRSILDVLFCFSVGYNVGLNDNHNEYDTVEERYQKVKYEVQSFIAFQIGICTFKWSSEQKKYLSRPFCFYVFPRSKISDTDMSFQVRM